MGTSHAARLALARAAAGTLRPALLLLARPPSFGAGPADAADTLLGSVLPIVGVRAATAPTARERIAALELLRAWLLRVKALCAAGAAGAGAAVDGVAPAAAAAARPRLGEIGLVAVQNWAHANAKLAKLASVVLATTAATELAVTAAGATPADGTGAGAGSAGSTEVGGGSVLAAVVASVLAQRRSSKPRYAALLRLLPHMAIRADVVEAAQLLPAPASRPGSLPSVLQAMFDAMADGAVAAAAAAVVAAALRRMAEFLAAATARDADADGAPTPLTEDAKGSKRRKGKKKEKRGQQDAVTQAAALARCRCVWVPRLARVLLRSTAAQAALPPLLRIDGGASVAIACSMREQAARDGGAPGPSGANDALLRALLALREAHTRTGAKHAGEGYIVRWHELCTAAVHADGTVRVAALRALLHDEREHEHAAMMCPLLPLPPPRAVRLVCRIFAAELGMSPAGTAALLADTSSSGTARAAAQDLRAAMRTFMQRLELVAVAAHRALAREVSDTDDSRTREWAQETLARAGVTRAEVVRISLSAAMTPAAHALPPRLVGTDADGDASTDTALGGGDANGPEDGDMPDDDDDDGAQAAETADDDGIALTTALETLVAIVSTWPAATDALRPPVTQVLGITPTPCDGEGGANAAPEADADATLRPVSRQLLLLLAHGRPRVRLLAEQLLTALPIIFAPGAVRTILSRGGALSGPLALLEFTVGALEERLAQSRAWAAAVEHGDAAAADDKPLVHGLLLCVRQSVVAPPDALLEPAEASCALRLLLRAQLRLKHMGALHAVEAALQGAVEAVLLLAVRNSGECATSAGKDNEMSQEWERDLRTLLALPNRMMVSLCQGLGAMPHAAAALLPSTLLLDSNVAAGRQQARQQRFLLRRSAGFAASFLALARAEPSSVAPVLLHSAVETLVAASCVMDSFTGVYKGDVVALGYRTLSGVVVATLLCWRAVRKRSLTASGCCAAFVVALISWAASLRFGLTLIASYYTSTKLTRVGAEQKQSLDAGYKVGGQRGAAQVLACSAPATAFALAYALLVGDDAPVDFDGHWLRSFLLCAYLGHYACCNGDTWASELGMLEQGDPWLITTLRRVPRGTNGGVSVAGLLASLLGGALIGVVFLAFDLHHLGPGGHDPHFWQLLTLVQGHLVSLGAAAGLLGSLLDSLLGATLQPTYYDTAERKVVSLDAAARARSTLPAGVKLVCGRDVLD
eukprot:g3348.t1